MAMLPHIIGGGGDNNETPPFGRRHIFSWTPALETQDVDDVQKKPINILSDF